MTIRVLEVGKGARLRDWLSVPYRVHADDPVFVPIPDHFERRRVSPKHTPFARFGEFTLFVAFRGGEPVGRISAQVNHQHLARHRDNTGHFGFFCCQDDPAAANALVSAASEWLSRRGRSRMVGPVNFSLNEESGCLVSGFDTPAAILMPHARPFTGGLLEQAGLSKEIDLFAYRATPADLRAYMTRFNGLPLEGRGLHVRRFNHADFSEDINLVADIYADAWQDNWGFVPFAPAEVAAFVKEMPQLLRDNYARFVYLDDEPVGFMVALLNINELLIRYNGRMLPWNWLHMLWSVFGERTRTARIPLLGIRRPYQSTPLGGLLLATMFDDLFGELEKYPLDWIELSWILETNRRMNGIAESASGPPVKVYRLFGKDLRLPRRPSDLGQSHHERVGESVSCTA